MNIISIILIFLGSAFLFYALFDSRKNKKNYRTVAKQRALYQPYKSQSNHEWCTTKTVTKITSDLPGVFKDDVDTESAVETATRMGKELGMSVTELAEMAKLLKNQIAEMPAKPPETNDECPECGEMFAMVDDYLCPICRAKA